MKFEWDNKKNRVNTRRHGVTFEEASEIFNDPFHISVLDKRFDYLEERWITVGLTGKGRIIVAGHLYIFTEDGEEVIRIIAARKATKKERKQYETVFKKQE